MTSDKNAEQIALESALRNAFSPEAIVLMSATLQAASTGRPFEPAAKEALHQCRWFAEVLRQLVPVGDACEIMDEIGI
jgi:hypothetical protein